MGCRINAYVIEKNKMVKVSIIVPCFNQGRYLSATLDTVLTQTYQDWECIILNDGSTDDSELIALSFVEKDQRFIYKYQINQGVCIARNNAINHSIGDYILCLDADDKISMEYLALAVEELNSDRDVKLVACHYSYFGKRTRKVRLEPYSLDRLMGHNLFVNCSMFRRVDFEAVNGFNENMKLGLEDWDFWLSILESGGKVKYLDGIHFYYRIKAISNSRNQIASRNHYEILRKIIWRNHKKLYSEVYSSPLYSSEYLLVAESKEYRIGEIMLRPFRSIINLIMNI